jgi:predicted PurR-regulated permease PerM
MFALLYAYLCVPRRLRFIVRWLAACFVIVVIVLVLILFVRILGTLPEHHRHWFEPQPHQPMSPDFISHHLHRSVFPRRFRED